MSKKHYEQIAAALRAKGQCNRAVQALADLFEAENPRFDRDRFLQACGVTA